MYTDSLCAQELVHVGHCKHLSVVIATSNRVLTYGVALEITDTVLPNCQFPLSMEQGKLLMCYEFVKSR